MFAGGRDRSVLVPNCLNTSAPVRWRRNVLGPKCLDITDGLGDIGELSRHSLSLTGILWRQNNFNKLPRSPQI